MSNLLLSGVELSGPGTVLSAEGWPNRVSSACRGGTAFFSSVMSAKKSVVCIGDLEDVVRPW